MKQQVQVKWINTVTDLVGCSVWMDIKVARKWSEKFEYHPHIKHWLEDEAGNKVEDKRGDDSQTVIEKFRAWRVWFMRVFKI